MLVSNPRAAKVMESVLGGFEVNCRTLSIFRGVHAIRAEHGQGILFFSHKRIPTCPLLFLLRIETELDQRDASLSVPRSMKPQHATQVPRNLESAPWPPRPFSKSPSSMIAFQTPSGKYNLPQERAYGPRRGARSVRQRMLRDVDPAQVISSPASEMIAVTNRQEERNR